MSAFTDKEVKILSSNKYVLYVTHVNVAFTEEFKRLVYEATRSGKTLKESFRELGIEPDMLGEKRIEGFRYRLHKQALRTRGFTDMRTEPKATCSSFETDVNNVSVRQLMHELAYAKQEIEFLKKLREADMEAQKQWELKHRRK